MKKQYGLIYQEPRIQDYVFGAGALIKKDILEPGCDWSDYLPLMERQNAVYMDSMACVTFSALNCLETLLLRKYGVLYNFSDRFIAKLSGTTKQGNSAVAVPDTIRKNGLLLEVGWVYPNQRRTPPFTWDDYYADIPSSLITEAKLFLTQFEIGYEWIPAEKFTENLQYGPIQVFVRAWYDKNKDGVYESPSNVNFNHAVELIKPHHVFDSYEPGIKQLEAGYDFSPYGLQFTINKITMLDSFLALFKKKNDTKLVRNQTTGEWAWFYNDSLRIPKTSERKVEALANYLIKKEGTNISQEDWNRLPHVEL